MDRRSLFLWTQMNLHIVMIVQLSEYDFNIHTIGNCFIIEDD